MNALLVIGRKRHRPRDLREADRIVSQQHRLFGKERVHISTLLVHVDSIRLCLEFSENFFLLRSSEIPISASVW